VSIGQRSPPVAAQPSRLTLPEGAAGKVGELALELAPRAGRTRLVAARQRVPLHVGRVLYPQPDWPELAYLTVTMPTGGFVQGDRVAISILAHAGATAHVTSQSATRAYRCDGAPIHQQLRLEARDDALLEWWPDPLIPYAGADLRQDVELVVDEGSTLLVADAWLAGRIARGERHAYAGLRFTTRASRPDGRLLFRDTLRLEPARTDPARLGVLADALAVGTFYLLGPTVVDRLEQAIAAMLEELAPGRAAVTRLPGECGLLVRLLAERSEVLRSTQGRLLALARRGRFGRAAPDGVKP
jgi:urease accessory protein